MILDSGINKFVYGILQSISNFYIYFSQIEKYVAAICFVMAVGMACIKVFIGAAEFKEQIIKILMTVVVYFIMLAAFPFVMTKGLSLAMNLGYGAVFGNPVNYSSAKNKITDKDYYKWLDEKGGDFFTSSEVTDSGGNVKMALNFNIVDPYSGLIDLNKLFGLLGTFINCSFSLFPALSIFDKGMGLFLIIFLVFAFAIVLYTLCFILCLINYIMALVDFMALKGFGIIMIPLSLWEGTKSYTQAIIGAFGKIFIKMMVISAFLFLAVMTIINTFEELYLNSCLILNSVNLAISGKALLNLALSLFFQGPLIAVLCMQSGSIAGFLSGGNPQMSFGEFAQGAMTTLGAAAIAGGAAKGANNFKAGIGESIGKGVAGAQAGRDLGIKGKGSGNFGRGVGAAMRGMAGVGAQTMKALPGGLMRGMATGAKAIGLNRGMSAETFGPGMGRLFNGGAVGGSSSGGGSSGGGNASGGGNSISDNTNGVKDQNNSADGGFGKNENQQNNSGVYGKASGSSMAGNALVGKANKMAGSNSALARSWSGAVGFAGNLMNNMQNNKIERAQGNVKGNGRMDALKDSVRQTAAGNIAKAVNSNGGASVKFSEKGENVPKELRGQKYGITSRGALPINENGNSFNREGMEHRVNFETADARGLKAVADRYEQMKNEKNKGVSDSDALSIVDEANDKAKKGDIN